MRTFSAIALAASLYAVPAMSQVIFQVPDGDAARHEQRAQQDRANARAEMLLFSALPCSALALGAIIVMQIQPVLAVLVSFLKAIGSTE